MSDPNVQAQAVPQSHEVSAMQRLASDKMKTESAVSLAQMKMQDAEANRQIKVMDIQQRAHDAEANRAAKIQEKSLDIAHSLAVHPEAQGSIS